MTYGDATGTTGDYLEGTERLVSLLNRLRILEMPLLFAPNEGWCYVRLLAADPKKTVHPSAEPAQPLRGPPSTPAASSALCHRAC